MRIALTTYRGNPLSGGQGVYVRYLSEALVDLGHQVEVFSGQPYPEVADGVKLRKVPSLDLYRQDDPFRRPALSEFRDPIDALEYGLMCTAGFPEPLTFSLRVAQLLRRRADSFDVVHDNQGLGYGMLGLKDLPVIATVHHPCSIDRDIELTHAPDLKRRLSMRRWYAFTRMQGRVARDLRGLIAVSEAARADTIREFGVNPAKVRVVHNGVDAELFRPLDDVHRVSGRIVTTASSDAPLKGLVHLIEAVAKLNTERDVELVVVGKPGRAMARTIERFGVEGSVSFVSDLSWDALVKLYASAQIAVVPSLYEGFSLPAAEAMSCEVPLVATTAGALPEVVGDAAVSVPPGDAGALAHAIANFLDSEDLRARLGRAGRARVLDRFTWRQSAAATVESYGLAGARC